MFFVFLLVSGCFGVRGDVGVICGVCIPAICRCWVLVSIRVVGGFKCMPSLSLHLVFILSLPSSLSIVVFWVRVLTICFSVGALVMVRSGCESP